MRSSLLAAWDRAAKACAAVEKNPTSPDAHDEWLRADLEWIRVSGLATTYAVAMNAEGQGV